MRSNSGQRKETRHGQGKALAGAPEKARWELEMNMNMEHEQKMAMDRAEHDLRMSIMLQCVAAYRGSQILKYPINPLIFN